MKSFLVRRAISLFGAATCSLVLLAASRPSHAVGLEYAVYDSISGVNPGVNGGFVASTGNSVNNIRTFIGDSVNFDYPFSGPVTVTALDLQFAYLGTATTLSSLTVNLAFYDGTSDQPNTSILSNPVTGVLSFDIRQAIVDAQNAQNNTNIAANDFVFQRGRYAYQLVLPTTFQYSGPYLNGLAINYKAVNSGTGTFTDNDLTSVLRVGPAIARGSSGLRGDGSGGFLRNESGRTDYNFNQGDFQGLNASLNGTTYSSNAGVAMRIYTNVVVVPESNTLGLFAAGAAPIALIALRRRKK